MHCRPPFAGWLPAAWLLASLAAGCASLPGPARHAPEEVIFTQDTPLARIASASTPPRQQGLTGVRPLPNGEQAFDARVALARRAARTLDAQYYLLEDDDAGRQFLRELRDAARRGVRVRLLVDDLHSSNAAPLLADFAAHERVEVRLFNPLPVRHGAPLTRLLLSANDFDRVNRRMHNKLFIADRCLAVTGGRNIGDAYFMHAHAANFVDVDLLVGGAVLPQLNAEFEAYWNSAYAYPLQQLLPPDADRAAAQARFAVRVDRAAALAPPPARDALGRSPVSAQLAQEHIEFLFADVQLLADAPQKVSGAMTLEASALGQGLQRLREARSEVVIVSPYFIPGPRGMAMLREATSASVRVSVLTNSMAATDEPVVHVAYARYRPAMLDMGVTLRELSPGLTRRAGVLGNFRSSEGRLHAKLAVADRRWVLLGSMNMDGRSALVNTELGLLIDSPALAWELRLLWQHAQASSTYQVRRSGERLEWVSRDGATEHVQHTEPGVDWPLRLKTAVLSQFLDEAQL